MPDAIAATHRLYRSFGRTIAVDNLSLSIPVRSVYAFLGANGAGKTTTLRLFLGLLRPDSGSVSLFGQSGVSRAARSRIGALIEGPSVYPHLTGRENLRLTARLRRSDTKQIALLLDMLELTAAADRRAGGYSLGMKQRLGLAAALLGEPDLVILDEPTNGLDPRGIEQMRTFIRSLPERFGTTVLISSHLLAEVEQIATTVGIIHRGRLVFEGSKADLHAQMEPRLVLVTNQPTVTMEILRSQNLEAHLNDQGQIQAVVTSAVDAAAINRRLVERGIDVAHLSIVRPSVEESFLALTADTKTERIS